MWIEPVILTYCCCTAPPSGTRIGGNIDQHAVVLHSSPTAKQKTSPAGSHPPDPWRIVLAPTLLNDCDGWCARARRRWAGSPTAGHSMHALQKSMNEFSYQSSYTKSSTAPPVPLPGRRLSRRPHKPPTPKKLAIGSTLPLAFCARTEDPSGQPA